MNHAALLLPALIVEASIGYPRRWWHPVMAVGAAIDRAEQCWNGGPPRRRRAMGALMILMLVAACALVGQGLTRLAGEGWGAMILIAAATTGLAQRSLDDHARAVLRPLAAGDLPAARTAVAMIVGRDTAALDESGVATAAIESVAESFCDGVVMPACWFLLFGLPGMLAVKAINTADSIVGHRTPALAAFGWASARADDIAAWIPARLAGVLICLAGRGGWRTMLRYAPAHASPNGGWPEAAMAGALDRRLGGAVSYDGEVAYRATLGRGERPDAADLSRALASYRIACVVLWLLTGALAWSR